MRKRRQCQCNLKENWRRLLMTTKILVLFSCCFSVTLHAQGASLQQRVSLDLKEAKVQTLFNEIQRQTNMYFMFNTEQVEQLGNITVEAKSETVDAVLTKVFKDSQLTYVLNGNMIVVRPAQQQNVPQKDITIRGRVVDENGAPIVGVTVQLRNSSRGAITDDKGYYAVTIPATEINEKSRLTFSFIGMETVTRKLPANNQMDVVMKEGQTELDEVVVRTGYETIDKRKLTSAVQTLKMDDIKVAGINTIDQMLEGRIPGMIFMQNSGQVGAAPKLRIRGNSTVLGNREPLWVLDGVVLTDPVNVDPSQLNDLDFVNLLGNAISGLNPDDIEQIDVLKDASATALYGAKAGNGVIVITTKKGKIGAPTFTYSATGSYTRRPRYSDNAINLMNSLERVDVSRELIERGVYYNNITSWTGYEKAAQDYYNGAIDYAEFQRLTGYYETVNTDWFDLVCQDVFSHNHTLSLSGGSHNIRYYASLGMSDEKGAIKGEGSKRYSTSLNLTATYDRFTARFQLNGNVSERNYNPSDLGVLDYAYNMSRAIPAFNTDGSRYQYQRQENATTPIYYFNILDEMDNSGDETNGNAINMQAYASYKIIPDLKLEGTLSYGVSNTTQETYYLENTYYVHKLRSSQAPNTDMCPVGGELKRSETRNTTWMARLQANYMKFLDSENKHNINASAGIELNSQRYDGFSITRRGYQEERGKLFANIPSTYTMYYNSFLASAAGLGTITENLTNSLAWYGMAGYDYDNRYMVNLHIRGESSNLFGTRANDHIMPIWALSGRWNIKQDILKQIDWIDDLALRGSFGYQGNMLSGQTPYMIIQSGVDYQNKYGEYNSTIVNYPNPSLRWEKTASANISADFSFLRGKINGSLSYFYKKTKDAFLTKTISEINGINQYVVNSGTLVNQGVEVSLNFTPINNIGASGSKRGFVWRIDPQLGAVLNELINEAINPRNNVLRDEITYNDMLTGNVEIAGKPINTFYSYRFKGLSPVDGSPIFHGTEEENQAELALKYKEMNLQDVLLEVMEESGRREPYIQGGISNYFGYRNFGLSFNLTYSLGNKIRLLKLCTNYGTTNPNPQSNLRREFVDRWRKPGDENYTNIPALNTVSNAHANPWWTSGSNVLTQRIANNVYEMYDNSDIRVVSGDYLRLSSLSFRYNVDDSVCKLFGLKSAYLSLTGTNLFTLCSSKLKGQDPTQSGSTPSINLSVRPTYSFNLNLTF